MTSICFTSQHFLIPVSRVPSDNKCGKACGKLVSYAFHNGNATLRFSDSFTRLAMFTSVCTIPLMFILKSTSPRLFTACIFGSVVEPAFRIATRLALILFHFERVVRVLFSFLESTQHPIPARVLVSPMELSTIPLSHTVKRSLKFTFINTCLPLLKGSLN